MARRPAAGAALRQISARQIDPLLRPQRHRVQRRQYGRTQPGTRLKHHIALKTDRWDVHEAGYSEIDLVAHAGDRADGDFACSLNLTDIHTTWVETGAVLGKSQVRVRASARAAAGAVAVPVAGIDSDNGSEFTNAHLYRYCRTERIQFTRRRPYKKDGNAHIEQKIWTDVRKLLGDVRYDTAAAVPSMKAVYSDVQVAQCAREDPCMRRPLTTPGVGPVTAVAFVATVDRIGRFRNAYQLESSVGPVPRERSSSEKQRKGALANAGNTRIRWLLVEAAWRVSRRKPKPETFPSRTWADGVARRRGSHVAAVALARRLARRLGLHRIQDADLRPGDPEAPLPEIDLELLHPVRSPPGPSRDRRPVGRDGCLPRLARPSGR